MTTFNQFQKELQNRGIDPQTAYMFTLVYERLIQVAQEVQQCSRITLEVVESLQGVVALNEELHKRLNQVAKGMFVDGINVESVANDPDETK